MSVRIRRRKDPIAERRWFAVLCGTMVNKRGSHDVTRVFFPWFYVDFITAKATP